MEGSSALDVPLLSAVIGILIATTGFANMYANLRLGDAASRTRIFWIFEDVLVLVLMNIALMALHAYEALVQPAWDFTIARFVIQSIALTAQIVFVSMAIFYSGAMGSAYVVRRTAVISGAAGLAIIVFITIEQLITNAVQDRLGVSNNTGAVVAGVTAALAFGPVHSRLKRAMDRFVSRYDDHQPAPDSYS